MLKISFRAMGSQIAAFLDSDDPQAASMLEQAPAWFEQWEQSLSRFRPDSELSRLNAAGGSEVKVSPILWDVLSIAMQEAHWSGGLVVPNLLSALEQAGYNRSFDAMMESAAACSPAYSGAMQPSGRTADSRPAPENRAVPGSWRRQANWTAIRMDPRRRSVRLPAGMKLDFGGVGKGWAAQQALQRLKPFGPALVDAGGDIAASSLRADGRPWRIDVADPLFPGAALETLALGSGSVATSGIDHRRWVQDGVWKHHIIDPRRGEPAETDLLSVTVIAPDPVQAETAAKIILILGSQAGTAWLEDRPELSALLALQDGQVLRSSGLPDFYWRE
jgi:thiamine biosynthesis lipoprotein